MFKSVQEAAVRMHYEMYAPICFGFAASENRPTAIKILYEART